MFANTFNRILSPHFSLEHARSTIPAGETASSKERKSSDRVPAAVRNPITISKEAAISRNSRNYLDSTSPSFNPPSSSNFQRTHFSVLSVSKIEENRKCDLIIDIVIIIDTMSINLFFFFFSFEKNPTIILFWNIFRNFDLKIVLFLFLFIYK